VRVSWCWWSITRRRSPAYAAARIYNRFFKVDYAEAHPAAVSHLLQQLINEWFIMRFPWIRNVGSYRIYVAASSMERASNWIQFHSHNPTINLSMLADRQYFDGEDPEETRLARSISRGICILIDEIVTRGGMAETPAGRLRRMIIYWLHDSSRFKDFSEIILIALALLKLSIRHFARYSACCSHVSIWSLRIQPSYRSQFGQN